MPYISFMARYPSVELTVVSGDKEVSLTRREADVAVRMAELESLVAAYQSGRRVPSARRLTKRSGIVALGGEKRAGFSQGRASMTWRIDIRFPLLP